MKKDYFFKNIIITIVLFFISFLFWHLVDVFKDFLHAILNK